MLFIYTVMHFIGQIYHFIGTVVYYRTESVLKTLE